MKVKVIKPVTLTALEGSIVEIADVHFNLVKNYVEEVKEKKAEKSEPKKEEKKTVKKTAKKK